MAGHQRVLLVPVDNAEEDRSALAWAMKEVWREGDLVEFLHVVTLQPFGSGVFTVGSSEQPLEQADLAVEQTRAFIQERLVPLVDEVGASYHVQIIKGQGDGVGDIICHKAEEMSATLIVMAAHKRGIIARLFVGSVTQHCIHKCKATVLVWRGG